MQRGARSRLPTTTRDGCRGHTAGNDGCTAANQPEPAASTDRPTHRPQSPGSHSVTPCVGAGDRSSSSSSSPGYTEHRGSDHLPCGCVEPRTAAAARRRRERSADYPKVVPDKLPSQALKSERIHDPQMARLCVCVCMREYVC